MNVNRGVSGPLPGERAWLHGSVTVFIFVFSLLRGDVIPHTVRNWNGRAESVNPNVLILISGVVIGIFSLYVCWNLERGMKRDDLFGNLLDDWREALKLPVAYTMLMVILEVVNIVSEHLKIPSDAFDLTLFTLMCFGLVTQLPGALLASLRVGHGAPKRGKWTVEILASLVIATALFSWVFYDAGDSPKVKVVTCQQQQATVHFPFRPHTVWLCDDGRTSLSPVDSATSPKHG